ncbi:MAG: hypothetical protein GY928_16685 [Colwellia sp.]|nr:hypothetical protein [Colwellia sp.]
MNDNTDDYFEVLDQLKEIKEGEKKDWNDDVIKRTISSLLSVEKKSLYGSLRGKSSLMDDIILSEMKNSKEQVGVTEKD